MSYIEWNDTYSVKINEIDEQHKKLISLINELHNAMSKGKSKEILESILSGLVDYTVEHFSTEEKYMDKFNYPDSLMHKKEHQTFVRQVQEYQEKLKDKNFLLSIQVMNFLKDWLLNHILGLDKKYSDLFIENGLK